MILSSPDTINVIESKVIRVATPIPGLIIIQLIKP